MLTCSKMLVCLLLSFLLGVTGVRAEELPKVRTEKGVVEGLPTADGKVVGFRGIPYAAPPVGELRWKPPVAVEAWTGVREAKGFGYRCVQPPVFADMQFHDMGASEDCLTLNVWAPAGAKPGTLPVMVWIYGGGYQGGASSEGRQDGEFLAHKGVVVVSMNYRLGVFGFFAHPELTAESPHYASGNYGLMDQAAVLQWVRRNIKAFGGDAGNVTLFGESAGSFSVSTLMASPVSRGLIKKAIGESGGALESSGPVAPMREVAEKLDAEWAERALGSRRIADLRRVPTEDVLRAVMAKPTSGAQAAPRFNVDVDGYFLPEPVATIYAEGKQAQVPLLAGWNADEQRGSVVDGKDKPTVAGLAATGGKDFPGREQDFLKAYRAGSDEEAVNAASDYAGDKFIAYSTWRWLDAQVKTSKAPVYRYFFTLGSPGDRFHKASSGAFHSDEIEYVFGALDARPEAVWRAEDRALSEQMMTYWTNFAKTGDPNGAGLPVWPKYGPTEWMTMNLGATSEAKPDSRRERYLFLDSAWGKAAGPN